MRRAATVCLLLLCAATRAFAGTPPTRTQTLLIECRTPGELRARLEAYADSTFGRDSFGSGEACAVLGASFSRSGARDSALAWCTRALDRRGDTEDRLAVADLLLDRRRGDDVARVTAQLRKYLEAIEAPGARAPYQARLAWALHLAARSDTAAAMFAEIEGDLASSLEWSARMGRTALAAGRPGAAMRWLMPVAMASRGLAADIMDSLNAAAAAMPAGSPRRDLAALVAGQVAALDREQARRLDAFHARRVTFNADDGFPLAGAWLAAADSARHLGAVVLLEPGGDPTVCDSLAGALLRANLAVLLLDRRGSGASVGPACPTPFAWHGREEALDRRCARDVRDGLRALARATPLDTSRYVVAGIGEAATTAVRAALLDPRARALLLVSPSPHPVDRGVVRAGIAKLQRPIFFQLAPEDFLLFELTDVLYQAGLRPVSRVSDSHGGGQGAAQFRDDPAIAPRLIRWLAETLPPPARPVPRPARRRRR